MQFIQAEWTVGADVISRRLREALAVNKAVLWLLSGGSNIQVEVAIMGNLLGHEQNLTIAMADERYGPPGHADSNWQQLQDAGFRYGKASLLPTLYEAMPLEQTAIIFNERLEQSLSSSDLIIGQFGIGDDGHIAGILPDSSAVYVTNALATGYKTDAFERVTMTFAAFQRLSAAYCFVYGSTKLQPLRQLMTQNLELATQPAQILKQLTEAVIFNDQVGGENI